jgi:hypothetical protein
MEHAIAVALGSVHARAASFPPNHSAEIVAFPRPPAHFGRNDADRLDSLVKAAEKLEAALSAQKAAVAVWRGSLASAAQSLGTLEASMLRYESRLSALDLSEISARNLELAAIMDKAIAKEA